MTDQDDWEQVNARMSRRINDWLVARDAAGWFDGHPTRHMLRAQLRIARRHFDVDSPPVTSLMFAFAREAWDSRYVIDERHCAGGRVHISVSELVGGHVLYERGATPTAQAYMLMLEAAP